MRSSARKKELREVLFPLLLGERSGLRDARCESSSRRVVLDEEAPPFLSDVHVDPSNPFQNFFVPGGLL